MEKPPLIGEIRRRLGTILVLTLGGLGLLVVFGGGSFLHSDAAEWPTLMDPSVMRHEATVLCRREAGWRELQPTEYPPAMLKLRPQSISVSGERVYVALVPVPGGKRFHGYYIWPDAVERSDGGIIREQTDGETAQP